MIFWPFCPFLVLFLWLTTIVLLGEANSGCCRCFFVCFLQMFCLIGGPQQYCWERVSAGVANGENGFSDQGRWGLGGELPQFEFSFFQSKCQPGIGNAMSALANKNFQLKILRNIFNHIARLLLHLFHIIQHCFQMVIGPSQALSDFLSVGVGGPHSVVRRPSNVIYLLKGMTNNFHTSILCDNNFSQGGGWIGKTIQWSNSANNCCRRGKGCKKYSKVYI